MALSVACRVRLIRFAVWPSFTFVFRRSDAMRPRHWEQLQEEIQQQFNQNVRVFAECATQLPCFQAEDFTLHKLTSLNLHMHSDAIKQIYGVAQRYKHRFSAVSPCGAGKCRLSSS